MLVPSGRNIVTDQKFNSDENNSCYSNTTFTRLIAKKQKFTKVDFKYSNFDSCYLRECQFDSCDFTGCRFVGSNFHGSVFVGCKFDYTYFEKTNIDATILETESPALENIRLRFARTLRTNFQHLGDARSINRAISIELRATGEHLYNSWRSPGSYYRKKYSGFYARIRQFLLWSEFKALDFIWGNGESILKLIRFALIFISGISILNVYLYGDAKSLDSYWNSLADAPSIFLGVNSPANYNKAYLAFIALIRLIVIGFFLSIIIKRFNRR
ncbi:uncharacterized protein YjbI with pentapeptide repeats [Azospirillum lipoferum]|uniref:Pentapeptide repeat-containing protein n=1 Tax=Azospirillum lipoferum TaxID=193 RepID=A0A5A9GQX1_AZOLI|nr:MULTISPECIES: pentapeptide repeat-containing protein [Azospirillum]KAA0596770.1 pentapeptide repeat-containing protein [Azospirillum lipoferum]MCP1610799.1 uncharacterized protein YjbI with pentapeptide repeats [Azospirillum lipoferum]MDW5537758.1 pentapeptide repeat-containing protein [Azospirillum sp. NL1]